MRTESLQPSIRPPHLSLLFLLLPSLLLRCITPLAAALLLKYAGSSSYKPSSPTPLFIASALLTRHPWMEDVWRREWECHHGPPHSRLPPQRDDPLPSLLQFLCRFLLPPFRWALLRPSPSCPRPFHPPAVLIRRRRRGSTGGKPQ